MVWEQDLTLIKRPKIIHGTRADMDKLSLKGKKGLIIGIANDKSIAYGCAKIMREAGRWCGK